MDRSSPGLYRSAGSATKTQNYNGSPNGEPLFLQHEVVPVAGYEATVDPPFS
jgi:hypothetical protein